MEGGGKLHGLDISPIFDFGLVFYYGDSPLLFPLCSFMWSPVGGSSLGEKGVHDKTPYLGTFRLLFVRFVMPVVPSDGTSTAPNKKGVSPLHFQ